MMKFLSSLTVILYNNTKKSNITIKNRKGGVGKDKYATVTNS